MISKEDYFAKCVDLETNWVMYDKLQTEYDGLYMMYLSQVSLWKSKYQEVIQNGKK